MKKIFRRFTKDFHNGIYHYDIAKSIRGKETVYTAQLNQYKEAAHKSHISFLQPIDNGNSLQLLTASDDLTIKLWNISQDTFSLAHSYTHYKGIIGGVLSSDGKEFLFTDRTGYIFNTRVSENGFKELTELHKAIGTFKHFQLINHQVASQEKRFLLVVGDMDKIYAFKYPEIYEILAILLPVRKKYSQFLNLEPQGLVGIQANGDFDLIDFSSFYDAEFRAKPYQIPHNFFEASEGALTALKISTNSFLMTNNTCSKYIICELDPATKEPRYSQHADDNGPINNQGSYHRDFYIVNDENKQLLVTETSGDNLSVQVRSETHPESLTLKNIKVKIRHI